MVEYGWDQTPTPDLGLDISKAPSDIQKLYKWVIEKRYGEDVASAYAQGLVAAGIIAKNAEAMSLFTSGKMDTLDQFVKDTLIELTDKDIISAPEIIFSRDGEPTLADRLDRDFGAIESSMIQNVEYIYLSELGLDNNGINNLNKILNKLTKNNIYFVVDGDYPLASDGIRDLVYDFNLISFNNGSIIFNSVSFETYFDLKACVRFKNVKFKNPSQQPKILFTTQSNNNSEFEEFRVENCDFEGTIRLASLSTCGRIKLVAINGNSIKNTATSFFGTSEFIIDHVEIKNNYVENWFYRLFSLTNFETIEYMEIDGNYATNTEDWIFTEETPDGTYYVFALVKAKRIKCTNNTIKNMKASSLVALYDIYAYADEYTHENNIFENNVCYHPSRTGVLMKCKNEGGIKHFRNNSYKIEESFLNKFGIDPTTIKVKLHDIWGGYQDEEHTLPVSFYISDNTIDVPNLRFETGYRFVEEFYFERNTVRANTINDTMVLSKQNGATVVVRHNNIHCSEDSSYDFFRGQSQSVYNKFECSYNTLYNYQYLLATAKFKEGVITNNTLYNESSATITRMTNLGEFDTLLSYGNSLMGVITPIDLMNSHITKQMIHNVTGLIGGTHIYIDKLVGSKSIEIIIRQFTKEDIYSLTVDNNQVSFTDSNDNSRTLNIRTADGHGITVKNQGTGSSVMMFHNNSSTTRLTLSTNSTKVVEISYNIS